MKLPTVRQVPIVIRISMLYYKLIQHDGKTKNSKHGTAHTRALLCQEDSFAEK